MSEEKIIAARLVDRGEYWFAALSSDPTSFLEVSGDPRAAAVEDVKKLFEVRESTHNGKPVRTLAMRIARRFLLQRGAEILE